MLTLDTTIAGLASRDLDLAYMPFMRGMGIAQYVSDPVFRRELALPLGTSRAGHAPFLERNGRDARPAGAHTGPLMAKLRTGWPRQACVDSLHYSRPSLQWPTRAPAHHDQLAHPPQGGAAIRTTRVWPSSTASMGWWCRTTAAGNRRRDRVTGRAPAWRRSCRVEFPCCSIPGARGADVFRPSPGSSAVLWASVRLWPGHRRRDGVREVLQNVRAEFDLTMGLAGCSRWRRSRSTVWPGNEAAGGTQRGDWRLETGDRDDRPHRPAGPGV